MAGGLNKMTIEAFTTADYSGSPADSFTVLFNPSTYTNKYEIEWEDRQGKGDSGSPQVFGKIKPQEYTFEFVFDGTGAVADPLDVQETIEHFLTVTGKFDGEIHRPMFLKLSWGALISKCILKSAETTYTIFKSDGTPLRAKVKATFAENIDDTLRVAEERKSSPDLTHRHQVKAREHLTQLAYHYYRDPSRYLQVAQYNKLDDFRRLTPGQILFFPPIQDPVLENGES